MRVRLHSSAPGDSLSPALSVERPSFPLSPSDGLGKNYLVTHMRVSFRDFDSSPSSTLCLHATTHGLITVTSPSKVLVSQVRCVPSGEPSVGLKPTTLRSRPVPRSSLMCSRLSPQVPLTVSFESRIWESSNLVLLCHQDCFFRMDFPFLQETVPGILTGLSRDLISVARPGFGPASAAGP